MHIIYILCLLNLFIKILIIHWFKFDKKGENSNFGIRFENLYVFSTEIHNFKIYLPLKKQQKLGN